MAMRRRDFVGPALCALGAACMLGALSVDLDTTVAKALMAAAAISTFAAVLSRSTDRAPNMQATPRAQRTGPT